MPNKIKVSILDDHLLFRQGLSIFIENIGCSVHFHCANGSELISQLNINDLPDVVLIDIEMPDMDGFETTAWLKKNHPSLNVLGLIMDYDDNAIKKMLQNGAKGYIFKTSEPNEFKRAIKVVIKGGFYYPDLNNYKDFREFLSSRPQE